MGRPLRNEISPETLEEMQTDRDAGLPMTQIGKKHGLSEAFVRDHTRSRAMPTPNPIMPEEVATKRASLHMCDTVLAPVMQYNDDWTVAGYKPERYTVETVTRHVVVFRRQNGMRVSMTFVELCQTDRRAK